MTEKIPVPPLGAAPAVAEYFTLATQKPAVKFLSRGVQPPSQVYVTNQDVLTLFGATRQIGEQIIVTYRLLRADGELITGQFIVAILGDGNVAVQSEPLAEGFLLSLAVRAAVATTRGQTFARLFLQNPSLGLFIPSYMLMADYVTTAMSPAYPNGRVSMPTEGPGWVHAVAVANPPAQIETQFIVPGNVRWRLNTLICTLTTSATIINRIVGLTVSSPGRVEYTGGAGQVQGASAGFIYTWAAGVPAVFDGQAEVIQSLPNDFMLPETAVITTFTRNLQVGDQFTNATVLVEEWLNNV
jgi:hypothetical protein